jgi:molybdopterin/thiamine biosynthesis adenylyltransferase
MTEIVMSQTPPILHGPSEKERKYDRQLRLWAASGQAALESANILLLNSGAGTVGVEALKNLVLPGMPSSFSPRNSSRVLLQSMRQVLADLRLRTRRLSVKQTWA